jgi:hypothetical protein
MSDIGRLIWCALIGLFRSRAALQAEILPSDISSMCCGVNPRSECLSATLTCPYRKSHPNVLMVQTSEVRIGHDAADGLNSTQRWCILVQR